MKLCFISDSHNNVITVPECDVLIHSGDATNKGDHYEVLHFLDWFSQCPAQYKIFVPGNHDRAIERYTARYKEYFIDVGVHLLVDDSLQVEDYLIYGTPWCPKFGEWSFMLPRNSDKLEQKREDIPDNTNILISHSPPWGVLDYHNGMNLGCELLKEKCAQLADLKLVAFGHIHENYGIRSSAFPYYVNAGLCNNWNKLIYQPILLELP